jgi:hypothetical protein
MKRILILVAIVCLVVIAVFQYLRYRKFNMPNNYDYKVAENLDTNYHNQSLLVDYYTTAYQIGSLAREMWFNHGIDVMIADKGDTQSVNASLTYNQMVSKSKFLEGKLKESKRLKDLGFDNEDIKYIEENGLSEKNYKIYKLIGGKPLKNGDVSEAVWELQDLLVKAGFTIPIDGKFSDKTEGAVKEFQKAKNQYASGIADIKTVKLLVQ